jgi:hypothetical protein
MTQEASRKQRSRQKLFSARRGAANLVEQLGLQLYAQKHVGGLEGD